MKIKIKKLCVEAVLPKYAKEGDAGMDLTATSKSYDEFGNVVYGTGLAVEIPKGYAGFLFPRSSVSKQDLSLANAVGVVDAGYRGEIMVKFKFAGSIFNYSDEEETFISNVVEFPEFEELNAYEVGDRVVQIIIMPVPEIEFEETDELSDSSRGEGGFGSTGQ